MNAGECCAEGCACISCEHDKPPRGQCAMIRDASGNIEQFSQFVPLRPGRGEVVFACRTAQRNHVARLLARSNRCHRFGEWRWGGEFACHAGLFIRKCEEWVERRGLHRLNIYNIVQYCEQRLLSGADVSVGRFCG